MTGPRLGDLAFFNAMYLDRPGLEGVRDAVARADWPAAQRAFVAHIKRRQNPKWYAKRI